MWRLLIILVFIVISSSVVILTATLITMALPDYDEKNYIVLLPLTFMGVGYSIYAAVIWGSIPYVVAPRTLGTAFGLTTAIQNTGLVIAPLLVSILQDGTTKDMGFFWPLVLLACFSGIGFCFNIVLYFDDRKNRGSVLHNVA